MPSELQVPDSKGGMIAEEDSTPTIGGTRPLLRANPLDDIRNIAGADSRWSLACALSSRAIHLVGRGLQPQRSQASGLQRVLNMFSIGAFLNGSPLEA
jgi:hypothetical protein